MTLPTQTNPSRPSLPKINFNLSTFIVPSTGKSVMYRGYTVREEKMLLTAMEAGKFDDLVLAIKQIIVNCTDGALNPDEITTYDLESFFLKLRIASQGSDIKIQLANNQCPLKNGEGQCDQPTTIKIDLSKVKLQLLANEGTEWEDFTPDEDWRKKKTIMFTDKAGVVLRHPTFKDFDSTKALFELADKTIKSGAEADSKELDSVVIKTGLGLIARCTEKIFTDEQVFDTTQYSEQDLIDFYLGLDRQSMNKVEDFFDTIPKLRHQCEFKCKNCDFKEPYIIDGLRNFFG